MRKLAIRALIALFVFSDVAVTFETPLGIAVSGVSSAEARIGRPLTPMSYAGVARRTSRRTARRTTRRLAALPPSCNYGPYYGSYYYNCSGTYYVMDGGVYIQVIID